MEGWRSLETSQDIASWMGSLEKFDDHNLYPLWILSRSPGNATT